MNILKRLKIAVAFFAGMYVFCLLGAVYDPTGKEMINISGSTNILASVTNQPSVTVLNSNTFAFSLGNTVPIGVSNSLANPYLWTAITNSPTVTVANSNTFSFSISDTTVLGVTNVAAKPFAAAVTNLTGGHLAVSNVNNITTLASAGQVGLTNSWVSLTNGTASIGTVAATNLTGGHIATSNINVVAVSQSGTWDEVGINDSGNSITVDASNLDVQIGGSDSLTIGTFPDNEPFNIAQIGGQAPGVALPVTNGPTAFTVQPGNTPNTVAWLVNVTNSISSSIDNTVALPVTNATANPLWATLTNSTANIGNVGVSNSAGLYLWVGLTNAIPTGANAIGKLAANSGVDIGDVDVTSIAAGNNNIGDVDVASIPNSTVIGVTNLPSSVYWATLTNSTANAGNMGVTNSAGTYLWAAITNLLNVGQHNVAVIATNSGGYTPYTFVGAATVNTNVLKASAGTLGYISAFNTNSFPVYIVVMNFATNHTTACGETDGQKFMIPGYSTNGAGFVVSLPPQGAKFSAGIAYGTCTGMATNDNTAIPANSVICNFLYQ